MFGIDLAAQAAERMVPILSRIEEMMNGLMARVRSLNYQPLGITYLLHKDGKTVTVTTDAGVIKPFVQLKQLDAETLEQGTLQAYVRVLCALGGKPPASSGLDGDIHAKFLRLFVDAGDVAMPNNHVSSELSAIESMEAVDVHQLELESTWGDAGDEAKRKSNKKPPPPGQAVRMDRLHTAEEKKSPSKGFRAFFKGMRSSMAPPKASNPNQKQMGELEGKEGKDKDGSGASSADTGQGTSLAAWLPKVKKTYVLHDARSNTLHIAFLGMALTSVVSIKFRGSPLRYVPVFTTDTECRILVSSLPNFANLDGLTMRLLAHFGEARAKVRLSEYSKSMPVHNPFTGEYVNPITGLTTKETEAVATAPDSAFEDGGLTRVRARSRSVSVGAPATPGLLLGISERGFANVIDAVFELLRTKSLAEIVLRRWLFSDMFQEQLAEAGDIEMILSLFELDELHFPAPDVHLNAEGNEVTVSLSEVDLRATLAFKMIRVSEYFVYRDCGAIMDLKNLHGRLRFRVVPTTDGEADGVTLEPMFPEDEGNAEAARAARDAAAEAVRAAAAEAAGKGKKDKKDKKDKKGKDGKDGDGLAGSVAAADDVASDPSRPCAFDLAIYDLVLHTNQDIIRDGIVYARKENWGYTGVIISKMANSFKHLLLWLLHSHDFQRFLTVEMSKTLFRKDPTEVPFRGRHFVVDHTLVRMPRVMDSTAQPMLCSAHNAEVRLKGAEADAVYDALDEPVPIEEMLLRTSKQDVLLFLSARFFNSFLASLFLMKALDVTIKSADLPASMAALIDDGMLEKYNVSSTSELGALQIRARAPPTISFDDGRLTVRSTSSLCVVAFGRVVLDLKLPFSAGVDLSDLSITSAGLDGLDGIALNRTEIYANVPEEMTSFLDSIYDATIVPFYQRIFRQAQLVRLPVLAGMPSVRPSVQATDAGVVFAFNVPEFHFQSAQISAITNYLTERFQTGSRLPFRRTVLDWTLEWMESHVDDALTVVGVDISPDGEPVMRLNDA